MSVGWRWPPGIASIAALGGMIVGFMVAYLPAERLGLLVYAQHLGLLLFRSQRGVQIVMQLGLLAHVIETAYIWKLCRRFKCSGDDTLGWMLITMLTGFCGINDLKTLAARQKKRQLQSLSRDHHK